MWICANTNFHTISYLSVISSKSQTEAYIMSKIDMYVLMITIFMAIELFYEKSLIKNSSGSYSRQTLLSMWYTPFCCGSGNWKYL